MAIYRGKRSGTLAIWRQNESGQDRLLIEEGIVVGAAVARPASNLARSILPLFARRGVAYALYEADLVGQRAEEPVSLAAVSLAALRAGADRNLIEKTLTGYGDSKLRIRSAADLPSFSLLPSEFAFVQVLRYEPLSVPDARRTADNEKVALRTLYFLTLAGALAVYTEGQSTSMPPRPRASVPAVPKSPRSAAPQSSPPSEGASASGAPAHGFSSASPSPPAASTHSLPGPSSRVSPSTLSPSGPPKVDNTIPQAPSDLSPQDSALWNELIARYQAMDTMTYFQMLELDFNTSEADVATAYLRQIKKWHPDRLPKTLAPLRRFADSVFQHLTEAEATLTDKEQRDAYLKAVRNGGGTPESDRKINEVVTAALEFQKFDVLLRQKRFDEAEGMVQELIELVPEDPDYRFGLARLIWARDGVRAAEQVLSKIDETLVIKANHERARFLKGTVLLRTGDAVGAIEIFEPLAGNPGPRAKEAQRELRLAKMRAEKKPETKTSGFLSGFFGNKKK